MSNVELSAREIEMLVESLDHCIATCHSEEKGAGKACSNCEAAKELREKLAEQMG